MKAFRAIAAIMQSEARISLSEAKMTLVQSRLSRRLRERGLARFDDYVRLVHEDEAERRLMITSLTTNHTHFFRESHHFDHFRDNVLPSLQQKAAAGLPVRIWSAGCSSGEEVYSLAMTMAGESNAGAAWLRRTDVKLLATDISPPVVEAVRRATYPASAVEPIPPALRSLWLRSHDAESYLIADELRSLVTARVLNLFEPWPMRQQYDAIFCRNVMIYFDEDAKAELEARFVDLLAPGGYLYIGHSERLLGKAATHMAPAGHTIYRKLGGAA